MNKIMTIEEYKHFESEIRAFQTELNDFMDELGFTPYRDGSGDFGTRRFYKSNKSYVIRVLDMTPDYWDNTYPDGPFLGVTKSGADKWINCKSDLLKWITSDDNVYMIIKNENLSGVIKPALLEMDPDEPLSFLLDIQK